MTSLSKKSNLTRRQIREKVVQVLFQLSINQDLGLETAVQNLTVLSDEEHVITIEDMPYLIQLVQGITAHKIKIDAKIQEQLENWNFSRLTKVDLAILRLATFELFYVSNEEVPHKVAINEAIELAKQFSDDKAPKFINGILSNMVKD